tara:strand:- start:3956 stop:4672 length:717 start_codon:yes stop_codon:yes gene_type:complete
MAFLSVNNISKSFKEEKVLQNLSFDVKKSERVAIIGGSGDGKSTLLRLIAGFDYLDGGQIELNGQIISSELSHMAPESRNIGMVFQNYALFPHLNVMENICFGLGVDRNETDVKKYILMLGLEGMEAKYPHELSGGQQQRLAIGRSLILRPPLMLLDEVMSNVDVLNKNSLIKDISNISRELDLTLLFVTHDIRDAVALCDRFLFIEDGKLVQDGTLNEIRANPASDFIMAHLNLIFR